jgi:MOSC domain-containing protein YiiM
MIDARVVSVHVGRAAPLGPKPELSAFVKHAVEGSVMVGPLGLDGDEQADLTVHGGPDKAVYGYAASHYVVVREQFLWR